MDQMSLPVPFAKAVMSLLPRPVLVRGVDVVMRRMRGRHPKLFKNLSSLPASRVLLVPSDLPHAFALTLGENVEFRVVPKTERGETQAVVTGSLQALVDMLEGREDGDRLFFSRDIRITGDTSIIVGLRNTLDREEIDLFSDIASLCGPFSEPAKKAITLLDGAARRLRERMHSIHEEMHVGENNQP